MKAKKFTSIMSLLVIPVFLISCGEKGGISNFEKRLKAEEPYIGFYAAEKECISSPKKDYFNAREKFFSGISECEEDPEQYIDSFTEFCKDNKYLKAGYEDEWEKVLIILSYELYPNKPIFDFDADNIIDYRNIVYAEYPNKKLDLDLFLPEKPPVKPVPCIICIHGGGWMVNRRVWFEPFAKYLASRGMAAVTIDYRMRPAVKIIDCVYDTKAAVRWVRANADKYGIDADKIGAIGASAGAHLAALLATSANIPVLEGSGGNPGVSSKIQAAVGIATPVFKIDSASVWPQRLGLSVNEAKLVSPYEYVTEDSAPLYLIHGTADHTVDPKNSRQIFEKYKAAGAWAEIKWIPDVDHGFYEGTDIGIKIASEFFKKQFFKDSQ